MHAPPTHAQVRTDEQTQARDIVAGVVEAAKQELSKRTAHLPDAPASTSADDTLAMRRDQGPAMAVYVVAAPGASPEVMTAAAAAAASAGMAPAVQQHFEQQQLQQQHSGAPLPQLTRPEAYRAPFRGLPTEDAAAAGPRAQAEASLLAARLSGGAPGAQAAAGGGGAWGARGRGAPSDARFSGSLFADGLATSLTSFVKQKQAAGAQAAAAAAAANTGWDGAVGASAARHAGQASAQLASVGMAPGAPVQPSGLATAMAAFDAQARAGPTSSMPSRGQPPAPPPSGAYVMHASLAQAHPAAALPPQPPAPAPSAASADDPFVFARAAALAQHGGGASSQGAGATTAEQPAPAGAGPHGVALAPPRAPLQALFRPGLSVGWPPQQQQQQQQQR